MSERSLEAFISNLVEPPELDADEEQLERNFKYAYYESSKIEIIDSLGNTDFEYIWITLNTDIKNTSIKLQRIFSEQILDKITEIYDFTFPINILLETQYEIDDFYQFLEFLEYNNVNFLSRIWNYSGVKNLVDVDIEKYCQKNIYKIIKEIEEQLEIHPENKLITTFLKSYYKEKMIEWFIKNSKYYMIDITVSNML